MKVGKEEEKNWIATAAGICTLSYLVGYFELSLIYVLLLSILYVALVVRHLNKTSTGSQGQLMKNQPSLVPA